jgi:hypothetical protein
MNVKTASIYNYAIVLFLTIIQFSCQTKTYVFVNKTSRIGVDLRNGKWLLNEIDCHKNIRDKLTSEVIESLKPDLQDRLFFIKDVKSLLITRKTDLNPNKTKLKELRDGTGFDYFINIKARKNNNDLNTVEIYQDNTSSGKNESEVILEIYDLNLLEIIYSQRVVGTDSKDNQPSVWQTPKSNKLIDNIDFYKSSNGLMLGSLKKILKDLKKKSIKN